MKIITKIRGNRAFKKEYKGLNAREYLAEIKKIYSVRLCAYSLLHTKLPNIPSPPIHTLGYVYISAHFQPPPPPPPFPAIHSR